MSIIYNNQVVAGKYTQQVVADADTVNAGIIKLATEEQVIEGVDNTTAITPFYLAQKQDKISAGDGIVIDNNEISCTINPDEQTIIRKDNGTMQCIGQLTKSNTLKFDWEGTQAEYNVAYLNGTIQPDWYCYITDDEEFVDYADVCNQSLSNLRPDGEARFDSKSNIDLDNLSDIGQSKLDIKADKSATLEGYGITNALGKNQITNCLLEVPQNIKLELVDGTLTLKAGSKVIVPNGFEADGVTPKFDYVVIEIDLNVQVTGRGANSADVFFISRNGASLDITNSNTQSGETIPSGVLLWYDTKNNKVHKVESGAVADAYGLCSFPICITRNDANGTVSSIEQVFNGMGYIGSTIWVDKGVKGLIPNGRNEDGTLNNIGFVTDKLLINANFNTNANVVEARIVHNGSDITLTRNTPSNVNYYFDYKNNYYHRPDGTQKTSTDVVTMSTTTNGIQTFEPKLTFRAVDYNDKSEVSGWSMPSDRFIDLTLGASGAEYTAPANGWVYIRKTVTASNQYLSITASSLATRSTSSASNNPLVVYAPVRKGSIFTINYSAGGDTNTFRFIYAEGEI